MHAFVGQNLLVRLVLDASIVTTLLKYNRPDSELLHWCRDQDNLIGNK